MEPEIRTVEKAERNRRRLPALLGLGVTVGDASGCQHERVFRNRGNTILHGRSKDTQDQSIPENPFTTSGQK